MRIVFFNIQTNKFFLRPFCDIILNKPEVSKNRYFFNYLLAKEDTQVCNFITKTGSTLPGFIRKNIKSLFLIKIETLFVFIKNKVSLKKVKMIVDPNELQNDDILFVFHSYFNDLKTMEYLKGIKLINCVHFYGLKEETEIIEKWNFSYYLFEVDLAKYSLLFQKNYLPWFTAQYIMLPYSFKNRFTKIKPFEQRQNKACAVGTVTFCENDEFIKIYGSSCYQPIRKIIYDNKVKILEYIDSFISPYNEKELKSINKNQFFLKRLYNQIYNDIYCGQQKTYYSFDMVEKYNDYMMFVSTEDINGSYGVGCFEGMACGTAMIGVHSGIYEDLGMEACKHYIPYDGTLQNLCEVIAYYQKAEHEDELKKIAESGYNFVINNFTEEKVGELFYKSMQKVYEIYKNKAESAL